MAAKVLYIIRRTVLSPTKRSYYIRGIDAEGRFYGTIRHFLTGAGRQSNTSGQLSTEALASIVQLAERVRGRAEALPSEDAEFRGVLADDPLSYAAASSKATIYRATTEAMDSPSGRDFTSIIEIIERHIPQ